MSAWESPWAGKKVMVVDDSPYMQKEVAKQFMQLGLEVIAYAATGIEALKAYSQLKPELVSLDIIMPEMHGLDCYLALRKLDPEVKAIFITCLAADNVLGENLRQGFPDYLFLEKPLSVDKLKERLAEVFAPSASKPSHLLPPPPKAVSQPS